MLSVADSVPVAATAGLLRRKTDSAVTSMKKNWITYEAHPDDDASVIAFLRL
jgi:hypothetical protein